MRVLLIDDDQLIISSLSEVLSFHDYEVETAANGEQGIKKLKTSSFDVIITDLVMDSISGLEVLEAANKHDPEAEVILITGNATVESAVNAIRKGAYDYLVKPFQIQDFLLAVQRGIEKRRLSVENQQLIADLQEKNNELESALDELKKTQDRLLQTERKAATVETVVAMKHEINNPLTAILNKVQVLREKNQTRSSPLLEKDLIKMEELIKRICSTLRKLDHINNPVSTQYCDGVSMLDISGSTSESIESE